MLMIKLVVAGIITVKTISAYAATAPELPRLYVDTSMPTTSITKSVCSSGCNYTNDQLQQAIDEAQLGTTILLQPGAIYPALDDRGFILKNKPSGSGWIIIRPATPDSSLPSPDTRISPSYTGVLPKITRGLAGLYAMTCEASAHHYRIIGIEFMNQGNADTPRGGAFINCDAREATTLQTQSHHIVFDRVYLHGPSSPGVLGVKFGIVLGGQYQAVINSHIEEIVSQDGESKAVGCWFCAGPLKIVNNFLSSAGENVMIGGADPLIANLVPSDIEFRHNHFFKPLKWKDPAYTSPSTGYAVGVKNLFELKNAQRVLVDGNVFENVWYPNNQSSFAIMITPRNQDGMAPWSIVQDLTFTNNKIIGAANGIAVGGFDSRWQLGTPSQHGGRMLFQNNLITNLGTSPSIDTTRGTGKLFMISNGVSDLQIIHNTVASYVPGTAGTNFRFTYGMGDEGGLFPLQNLVIQDNLLRVADAPLIASASLSTIAPGAVWTNTVIAGPWPTPLGYQSTSPVLLPQSSGNSYPSDESSIGYIDTSSGDYRLVTGSLYKNASSDGKDIGVDWTLFDAAQDPANSTPPVASTLTSTSSSGTTISSTSTTTTTSPTSTSTTSTETTNTTIKENSKRFLGKLKQLMERVR